MLADFRCMEYKSIESDPSLALAYIRYRSPSFDVAAMLSGMDET